MAPEGEIERERTYDLAPADAPAVHRVLLPPAGIVRVGDEDFRVRLRRANLVLHVYTRFADDGRRRVLIELAEPFRVRLSDKRWADRAGEPVKVDRRRWISEQDAWSELAGRWFAAFVKARYPADLAGERTGTAFRVRVDVMTPLDGDGAPRPQRRFAQLEIESRSPAWDPASVERDQRLWAPIGARLTPATLTKAQLASTATPGRDWSPAGAEALARALRSDAARFTGRPPDTELAARHGWR